MNSIKYLLAMVSLLAAHSAGAITVHKCQVHYSWYYTSADGTRTDLQKNSPDKDYLLAEGIDSNIMLADGSAERDRTDINASVAADGTVSGTLSGPMGVAFGPVGKGGSFQNGDGNVVGTITCAGPIQVKSLLKDMDNGALVALDLGLPSEYMRNIDVLIYRSACYLGDIQAAVSEVKEIPSALNVTASGSSIAFNYMGTNCLQDNGQSYEGYKCLKEQPVTLDSEVKVCDSNWQDWRNVPFVQPQHP